MYTLYLNVVCHVSGTAMFLQLSFCGAPSQQPHCREGDTAVVMRSEKGAPVMSSLVSGPHCHCRDRLVLKRSFTKGDFVLHEFICGMVGPPFFGYTDILILTSVFIPLNTSTHSRIYV